MKRLGQHFLSDESALKKMVDALEINPGDVILEIGPGHGELTDRFGGEKIKIIAVEKDKELVQFLKKKYENRKDIKIISGDALKILPQITKRLPAYKLVGNIPYYITGFLFRTLAELKNKPQLVVLTIQKEVAERLVSEPPKMNLLSASIRFWGEPEIIKHIDKQSFSPPPKVDSAIIKIIPEKRRIPEKGRSNYYRFLKLLFKQSRKTILNNLSVGINKNKEENKIILKKLKIGENLRPQNLNIEQIKELSALFSAYK